jgi:hypothetical protein
MEKKSDGSFLDGNKVMKNKTKYNSPTIVDYGSIDELTGGGSDMTREMQPPMGNSMKRP